MVSQVAQATFTLTFDTELIWGSFDHYTPAAFERDFPDIRGTIRAIIALLEQYEVSATWAVVGHLFLTGCTRSPAGLAHSELVRPNQRWRPGDWYTDDPCTDRARDPLWYGEDILDLLQSARVPQEIGCHSFSHVLFGDPDLSRDAVESDLDACVGLAQRRGIELRSFVFPRNSEGHHEVLRSRGFTAYRGADPARYQDWPRPLFRAAHLSSHLIGASPPVSRPSETLPGLWNIPGSTLFVHRTGLRRAITRTARIRRAEAGLRRAQDRRGVFHLWTHPFNLASDRPFLVGVLDEILRRAVRARDRAAIVIEPMGRVAERLATGRSAPASPEASQPDHGNAVRSAADEEQVASPRP
jgi:peptidoglycan/xylan/chitin deacetylase (PgdA/CDA1 family)